jgi:hypothetical protein
MEKRLLALEHNLRPLHNVIFSEKDKEISNEPYLLYKDASLEFEAVDFSKKSLDNGLN